MVIFSTTVTWMMTLSKYFLLNSFPRLLVKQIISEWKGWWLFFLHSSSNWSPHRVLWYFLVEIAVCLNKCSLHFLQWCQRKYKYFRGSQASANQRKPSTHLPLFYECWKTQGRFMILSSDLCSLYFIISFFASGNRSNHFAPAEGDENL